MEGPERVDATLSSMVSNLVSTMPSMPDFWPDGKYVASALLNLPTPVTHQRNNNKSQK
jgi:hypothetical protein